MCALITCKRIFELWKHDVAQPWFISKPGSSTQHLWTSSLRPWQQSRTFETILPALRTLRPLTWTLSALIWISLTSIQTPFALTAPQKFPEALEPILHDELPWCPAPALCSLIFHYVFIMISSCHLIYAYAISACTSSLNTPCTCLCFHPSSK